MAENWIYIRRNSWTWKHLAGSWVWTNFQEGEQADNERSSLGGGSHFSGRKAFGLTTCGSEVTEGYRSQGTRISMVGSIEEFQIRHIARMAGSGSMGMARRIRSMLSSDFEGSHAVSRRCVKRKMSGQSSACYILEARRKRNIAVHEPTLENAVLSLLLRGASCYATLKYAVLAAEMTARGICCLRNKEDIRIIWNARLPVYDQRHIKTHVLHVHVHSGGCFRALGRLRRCVARGKDVVCEGSFSQGRSHRLERRGFRSHTSLDQKVGWRRKPWKKRYNPIQPSLTMIHGLVPYQVHIHPMAMAIPRQSTSPHGVRPVRPEATLQCLHHVPDLKEAISGYQPPAAEAPPAGEMIHAVIRRSHFLVTPQKKTAV